MKAAYYCGDRTVALGECRVQSPSAGQVRVEEVTGGPLTKRHDNGPVVVESAMGVKSMRWTLPASACPFTLSRPIAARSLRPLTLRSARSAHRIESPEAAVLYRGISTR